MVLLFEQLCSELPYLQARRVEGGLGVAEQLNKESVVRRVHRHHRSCERVQTEELGADGAAPDSHGLHVVAVRLRAALVQQEAQSRQTCNTQAHRHTVTLAINRTGAYHSIELHPYHSVLS